MIGFMGKSFAECIVEMLTKCQPYPGDNESMGLTFLSLKFHVVLHENNIFTIYDNDCCFNSYLHDSHVCLNLFSVGKWYAEQCAHQCQDPYQWETTHKWLMMDLKKDHHIGYVWEKRAVHLLDLGMPYNKESKLDMLDNWFEVNLSMVQAETFW
jgi:hypothetical protein